MTDGLRTTNIGRDTLSCGWIGEAILRQDCDLQYSAALRRRNSLQTTLRKSLIACLLAVRVLGLLHLTGKGFGQQARPAPPPMPAILRNYQPVTAERLRNPEAGNWLTIRRTYDGWGYSPLTQIT